MSKKTRSPKTLRADARAALEACAGLNVRLATRRITQFLEQRMAGSGLSFAQFGLMAEIASAADDTITALAERMGLDQSTLSRTLRTLEGEGLVEIAISEGDQRKRMVWLVAMKPIAAELGTSRSGPAGAGSIVYIGAAFGGIVAGWLAGKLGVRRVVMFGGTMVAAGLALSASGGMLELYAGHGVLMGLFGTACMFSPLITYVSRWFERRRGAAVALISSGQAVAGAIWPPLLQLGVDTVGWRWTMVLFAILVVVAVAVLTIIFLHPPPEESAAAVGAADRPQSSGDVLGMSRNSLMILLMAAVFCCCVPMAVPMHHVPAFCSDLGMTPQYGAAMLSVLLGCAFLARQFWG